MWQHMGNGAATVLQSVKGWASQPFNSSMNVSGWALFVGLMITLAVLWIMILRDVEGKA